MDRSPPTLLANSLHLSFQTTQISPFLLDSPSIPSVNLPKFERRWPIRRKQGSYVSSNLGEKIIGDIGIACGVTFTIVPFLTIVDKAIVQSAAGSHSMMASGMESAKNIVRNPGGYLKSPLFLLMWGTYAATYSTANSLKTLMEHREYHYKAKIPAQDSSSTKSSTSASSQSKIAIFLGTSVVNSGASLMKDQAYARMFGTAGAATSVPFVSMGLWATRDFMVVGSSFILPDIMSKYLQEEYNMHRGDAQKLSQLSLPVATQFLAGPIQLLGLDFYNRPLTNMSFGNAVADRVRFLAKGFVSVVTARIIRIAPGYGIGGVLNTQYRDAWRDQLIQKEIVKQMETQDDEDANAQRLVRLVASRHSPKGA
mmetsp:Transcript_23178/g.38359  ORF Transcript_23178/g.38359 Transcript_23178/m.38359 type:complete len:368 (+) Transcript_23178:95-1198(+)